MLWSDRDSEGNRAVEITVRSRHDLLRDLEHRLRNSTGFALATLNLDHAVKLRRMPEFRRAYLAQTHVTADGNPVVWLQRLAGQKVDLVPGADLVHPVAALAERLQVKVALVGATQTALSLAAARLTRQFPRLKVVLTLAPPMGFDPSGAGADATIAAIAASGAGVCFLALGAPRQEIFAARAHRRLPQVGFLSIGAGLDFIAGTQRRAPRAFRRVGAEWLWRLGHDPRRLAARYGACLLILPSLTRAAIRLRRSATARPEPGRNASPGS